MYYFLNKLYPTTFYSPYYEVIVSAAIGSGKSVISTVSMLCELYKVLCIVDPHDYFGIRPIGTWIVFALFSANKSLADDVNFQLVETFVNTSPWFRRKCSKVNWKSIRNQGLAEFPKNTAFVLGSSAMHIIGRAVLSACLDEGNFMKVKSEQAQESYLAIIRRMESRFLQMGGVLPGKIWLTSSPKHSTDFLSKRIAETRQTKRALIADQIPIWEIKEHLGLYSGEKFQLF